MSDSALKGWVSRRRLLATTALLVGLGAVNAVARTIEGGLPWIPNAGDPPAPVRPGPWQFFTHDEATLVEAVVDRLIPPDDLGVGGKDAGCAVFLDRQLAGAYGQAAGLYMRPPFMKGVATQGYQSPEAPAARYRAALQALLAHVKENYAGQAFVQLPVEKQDAIIGSLEKGELKLADIDSASFFAILLQDTQQGFFADPVYGGNRDMAGWKLVGFPGARYDYRDWVERHNEPYPLPPVGIMGRSDWTVKG